MVVKEWRAKVQQHLCTKPVSNQSVSDFGPAGFTQLWNRSSITITARNLVQLVIVITVVFFSFALNTVEGFARGGAHLMSGSAIVVRLEWFVITGVIHVLAEA